MKLVSMHAGFFIAAIVLAVCSPEATAQTTAQSRSKLQVSSSLQILSPARGADFSGYTQKLMGTVKRKWIYLMPESFYMGDTGTVEVRVQVRADGTFVNPDPKVERSSGKNALDSAAIAAIRESEPFPNFPSGFDGATIELKISFFYNVPAKKSEPMILAPGKSDAGGEPPK